jgi:PAS domain S-box-containing protein
MNYLLNKGAGHWRVLPEKVLMDQSRTLFWLADGGGRILYANNAFCRQFGVEGDDAGTEAQELVPRDIIVFFSEKHRRVAQSGVPYRKIHHFTRPDGRCCSFQVNIYTINAAGVPMTGGEAWEVSEFTAEKSEQEQRLAETIIRVQEQERTYLSHELHDNVIQIMISARLHLDGLKAKPGDEQALKSRASALILSAIEESRRLSRRLAASQLNNSGLLTSIAQLLNDLRNTGRFNIKFNSSVEVDTEYHLSAEKKIALYRIVQEELSNIVRHSRARNIRVNVMQNNSGVILYMFDDGVGFDLQTTPKGMGLASIATRAYSFKGMVDIVTSPGKGCSVTVLMPYD